MKRMKLNLAAWAGCMVAMLTCAACGGNKMKASSDELTFDSVLADTCIKLLPGDDSPCGELHLSVCYAKGPHSEEINDSILASGILSPDFMPADTVKRNPEQSVEVFKKQYAEQYTKNSKELYQEFGNTPILNASYEMHSTFEILRPGIATFVANMYRYDGGAHGQGFTYALNFEMESGKLLRVSDLVQANAQKALCDLLVKKLAKQFKVKDLNGLKDLSVFSYSDVYVPRNFIMKPDSITFIYQADEIAAHACGEIRVGVSNAELDKLSKP